ncbi:MAG: hypothetical protein CO113_19295 [Elusimicrobia bacterium CG_4_9_14_3_um_filter_62_55]|nr:MAG: hypothetical protein COR54_09665 [Elusimicrobia bacterium CG22_combo_CG10-13_8_21_14_all_63_91]PJA11650.1 MAG: hypothetical protein COX66_19295 [Elusimicrobia bacterium CG_4_10_14_0_2_um_filter_63_34]PJB23063.1 MAG: hypothetical protein CO113_19295 [Elusimicrobia bacterium CG_4_9_14_3_um_filter_62_55]
MIPPLCRLSLALVLFATILGLAALFKTTALTLGFFGGIGIPSYGLAASLYVFDVFRDLKRHGVL